MFDVKNSETENRYTEYLSEKRTVCVIVPAFNAAHSIGACLQGLLDAGFNRDEILVVDDGSADGTLGIVDSFSIPVRSLTENLGAAAARNAGANDQKADILCFVDADVVVSNDIRDRLMLHFHNSDVTAVFGAYDIHPKYTSPFSRLRNLLHHHVHTEAAGPIASFWTGIGAVRRDAFEDIGGFNAGQRMLEDIDFGMRLNARGYVAVLDPNIQGTHWKYWSVFAMARADFWDRAVPWARLLRDQTHGRPIDMLNVSWAGRVSVCCAGLLVGSVLAMPFSLSIGIMTFVAAASAMLVANARFLKLVLRLDGPIQLVWAFLMLWLHFLCAGLGYLLVTMRIL